MSYLFLTILAILPSIVWLLFYLRKDAHPESNPMILKVFVWGVLAAVPAVLLQLGFFGTTAAFTFAPFFLSLVNGFIGVSLVEELLKYSVVRGKVLPSLELDEPLDVMLYMIIAALGFAALENVLKFLSPDILNLGFQETIIVAVFIFISSTFLHALASGIFGFFMALSFFETNKRFILFATGLFLATLLHGLYNFYIMMPEGYLRFLVPTIIIVGLALFVSFGFRKLKKMQSICKI